MQDFADYSRRVFGTNLIWYSSKKILFTQVWYAWYIAKIHSPVRLFFSVINVKLLMITVFFQNKKSFCFLKISYRIKVLVFFHLFSFVRITYAQTKNYLLRPIRAHRVGAATQEGFRHIWAYHYLSDCLISVAAGVFVCSGYLCVYLQRLLLSETSVVIPSTGFFSHP